MTKKFDELVELLKELSVQCSSLSDLLRLIVAANVISAALAAEGGGVSRSFSWIILKADG